MPHRFWRLFYLGVVLLVSLMGCDLSPPTYVPTTTSTPAVTPTQAPAQANPTPTPSPTVPPTSLGTLRGFVTGRNGRLAGVRVFVGSAATTTAAASGSATDENGNPVTLGLGEFILPNVPFGQETAAFAFDDASRSMTVTVATGGETRLSSDVYLPTDGPVPNGSSALGVVGFQLAASASQLEVEKASSTASLQFIPPSVAVLLKAPPNSQGALIHSFSFAYVQSGSATMSVSPRKPLPSNVTVLPAGDASHSGPISTLANLDISDSSNALASSWDFTNPHATLTLYFYDDRDTPVLARDGTPLTVTVPCLLIH